MNHVMKAHLLILLATAATAAAQYTMDWHTMDGGGASGAGGTYEMRGTLGQPDAYSGNSPTVQFAGGFWSFPDDALPLLRIFIHNGDIVLAWPEPSPGFVLQETPDLAVPDWADIPYAPSLVGEEWMLNWGPPVGKHFFRLRRP
jgi:hypothetical protein